jgi:hypothetical protein
VPVITFSPDRDTVRSNSTSGGSGQGCGKSKHLYIGRQGSRDYDSFLHFPISFTGMATITAATLDIYTDEYDSFGASGEPGIMTAPGSTDTPKIVIRRLTSAFTEGNNADGHFDSTDYVNPSYTTSGQKTPTVLPKGSALLHQLDVLTIVKAWAPSSVSGGGKASNHGFGLYGYSDSKQNWSAWSREHGNVSERPVLTITYTLGPTIPNVPQNMVPVGAQASVVDFGGDFSDIRATDTLQSTNIEIYDNGVAGTATASSDLINKTAHGLHANDLIRFTSLTGGAGLTAFATYYVHSSGLTANAFKLRTVPNGAGIVAITTNYSALTYSKVIATATQVATNTERTNARFQVDMRNYGFNMQAGVNYRWRAQYKDQEGQTSPWSGLVTISLTDTPPNAPTLLPVSGASFASLNLVKFQGGTFSDSDAGDHLDSHQVQLSPFLPGSSSWNEPDGILWDSGQTSDPLGATDWTEYYSGRALAAGTYYWRARQWDQKQGVSAWTYATIVLTQDFNPDPGSYDAVQINPKAPWRILIRDLLQADGVTPTVGRAPGRLVAVFEEAKNVGASLVYNSPGEIHFTLLKDDQQLAAVQPKQVHYAVEFYSGDGWQEKFAGVIWDVDATETDVVFKGVDYLALYDTIIDERYDPLKPNKSYKSNGSYYEKVTIRNIVLDQLNYAKKQTDGWVGFIAIGAIATMNEKVSVYSTMQPTLSFIGGLLDSHRQGQGIRTRMKVVKTTTGTYQLQIIDNPGSIKADLALYYGELVQGYRVIIFGQDWANVQHVVGRNRDGVKVVYKTIKGQAFQPSTSLYGRIATVAVMDGVEDQADLNRRGLQAAMQSAKLGKNIAIGIRTLFLQPLQGWDVCDVFPVHILDGAVNTDAYGSGYWAAYACAWEATDIGEQSVVITLLPREDSSAPDPALIPSHPISPQPEWQLGWTPPDPLKASSLYWYDGTTGKVYKRVDSNGTLVPVTGTA